MEFATCSNHLLIWDPDVGLTDTYTFVARNTNKAGVYITYNTPAYVLENGGLTLFIELFISTLAGAVFGISAVFFKKEG